MKFNDANADYHVHCGQYYDNYFQPSSVIKALHNNGIKKAWISSTTSCIDWSNQKEKEYLITHINDEIEEAVFVADEVGLNLTPLYWVIPKRHLEGESVETIIINSFYKGFKIHTKVGLWTSNTPFIKKLFEEVCICARKYNIPILIHTGVDHVDSPKRFEEYFSRYNDVKFILAHCKDVDNIIDVFGKYDNVFGDTAFCPIENFSKICESGFKSRMQVGTDFPINFKIARLEKYSLTEKRLTCFYNRVKANILKLTKDAKS